MRNSIRVQVIFELDQDELLKVVGHAYNSGFFYGRRGERGASRTLLMEGLRDYLRSAGVPMDDPELNDYVDRQARQIARKILGSALAYRQE